MAKRRITNEAIANLLGIHRNSVYNKIRGMGTFSVDEAITIRNNFFPDMKIEELFPPEQKGA
jgi:DNA-binding CsgD family transcriptional regulator